MADLIKNKQLVYLFLCNFSILFTGLGLFPLLPLYASEFGATSSLVGVYLAIIYIASSTGSILAGQLSERLPRSTLYIVAGVLGTPSLFLLGQARSLWQVVLLTSLVWFVGGMGLAISGVLASLHTTSSTRGKAFGLLALVSPFGALFGGIVVSRTMEWGGYPLMFTALAIVWILWPGLALTRIKDAPACAAPISSMNRPTQGLSYPHRNVFLFLLTTVFLALMTVNVGWMSLPLAMKSEQFSASDIGTAGAIGGLVMIPVTLLIGALSDTLGRKRFLVLAYLVAMAGTAFLVSAQELWQFWLVSSLILGSRSVIASMSPAYATDVLPRRSLGKVLPLISTMGSVSGVVGSGGAGYVLDTLGATSLYGIAALASLIALLVLIFLPATYRSQRTMPNPEPKKVLPSEHRRLRRKYQQI